MRREIDAWLQSSTTWADDEPECEVARLRKKVTELLLQNEVLFLRLEELEKEVSENTSDGMHADIAI